MSNASESAEAVAVTIATSSPLPPPPSLPSPERQVVRQLALGGVLRSVAGVPSSWGVDRKAVAAADPVGRIHFSHSTSERERGEEYYGSSDSRLCRFSCFLFCTFFHYPRFCSWPCVLDLDATVRHVDARLSTKGFAGCTVIMTVSCSNVAPSTIEPYEIMLASIAILAVVVIKRLYRRRPVTALSTSLQKAQQIIAIS